MAKKLELDPTKPLTGTEYAELKNHLRNSMLWYISHKSMNTGLVKEKLKDKDVPDTDFTVNKSNGESFQWNPVTWVLEFLQENLLIDDQDYAEKLARRVLRKGKGLSTVKREMWQKKVDGELAEETLEELKEDEEFQELQREGLLKAINKARNSAAYRKAEENKAKRVFGKPSPESVVIGKAMGAGFSYGEIQEFLQEEALREEEE